MQGNWLTKTTHAYVLRARTRGGVAVGWNVVMLHGYDVMNGCEEFWYPTFDMAVRAIPDLWRH